MSNETEFLTNDVPHCMHSLVDSELADHKQIVSWSDRLIESTEQPPAWLCELSLSKNKHHLVQILRQAMKEAPLDHDPKSLELFYIACLYRRYEDKTISWYSFLSQSSYYLFFVDSKRRTSVDNILTKYEEYGSDSRAENITRRDFLKQHNLQTHLQRISHILSSGNDD